MRERTLRARDFPLLSAIAADANVRNTLTDDPTLSRLAAEQWGSARTAKERCADNLACLVDSLALSSAQIATVSAELRSVYLRDAPLRRFAQQELAKRSRYTLDPSTRGADLLVSSWEHAAADLNHLLAVYGKGEPARYPKIDGVPYDVTAKSYRSLIQIMLDGLRLPENLSQTDVDAKLFFEPTLRFAVRLLQANSRDEAGRFWPVQTTWNAEAIRRAHTIAWQRYTHSVIVVPGAGSEQPNVTLSPWAKERLRLAVEQFKTGAAPFLLVTGGYVHPSQTPYCEAIEMRRYLAEVYGISTDSILVEPYARHTTTNLRNAVREIQEGGLPLQKPLLIVTDADQSSYILSATFDARNQQELGFAPVRNLKRLSPTVLEAIPNEQSAFQDAQDPLDP